ncbi:zona pellucida protein AX 1 [Scleropages formosus]|uniref:zona pellucida protein AX 1 n=1 Tax=Scleropages formosus TaxID=113540 RepID=UPI000877F3C9|nr:zona pellucida sperm-binding protein 2-like [Scleropages formosus]
MEFFLRSLWLLLVVLCSDAQDFSSQSVGIQAECLGNVLRVTVGRRFLLDNRLEVDAMYGGEAVPITNNLASQCGYSIKSDPWGNVRLFASVQNCFTESLDDHFNITLRLRLSGSADSQEAVHVVSKVCSYAQWAFREILCDRNYMEVSVRRRPLHTHGLNVPEKGYLTKDVSENAVSEYKLWKVLFYLPGGQKMMMVNEVQQQGYGLATTPTRLVLRGAHDAAESYMEDVGGVPMRVLKTSIFYKQKWMVTVVDAAVACPAGGLSFAGNMITWTLPLFIFPLLSLDEFKLLEIYMGIDGERLDQAAMATRGYTLSIVESYIVVQIPIGAVDGYYKSHAPGFEYHITFMVEPMLELLWQEEATYADTRYKVLYPITTPLMSRPPYVIDDTVPQEKVFKVRLGTFLPDVVLENITFGSQLFSVAEANSRGFSVQEHQFSNGNKTFSVEVPFLDQVVLKHVADSDVTVYTLAVVFGFIIFPELVPFSYTTTLEAVLQDIVLPTATGSCDQENFYIMVKFGNQGHNFRTVVGKRELTPATAQEYGYQENATHFSIAVPFRSMDVVYELIQGASVRSRLDLTFEDPINKIQSDFSLECSFPLLMAECFPNGTMTALAVKVESVPDLKLNQLTLRDPDCKPAYSNDCVAYFSFNVNTCGTTRKFVNNVMIYENEVAIPRSKTKGKETDMESEYRLQVSCHYALSATQTLAFNTRRQLNTPLAAVGTGELMVRMRISQDAAYNIFYQDADYPLVKYLREPLYFEVQLMQSTDRLIELFLENCWATSRKDMASLPKWDIIVDSCVNHQDGYAAIFHPVSADARVQIPSHFKRFEMKMFSFTTDGVATQDQIFVHCDVILCDTSSMWDSFCNRPCMRSEGQMLGANTLKRARRSAGNQPLKEQASSGPIVLADKASSAAK